MSKLPIRLFLCLFEWCDEKHAGDNSPRMPGLAMQFPGSVVNLKFTIIQSIAQLPCLFFITTNIRLRVPSKGR